MIQPVQIIYTCIDVWKPYQNTGSSAREWLCLVILIGLFQVCSYAREQLYTNRQSSRAGCCQRVHRIVYLAVKKVIIFWSIFYS